MTRLSFWRFRQSIGAFVALALLLASLIPVGFMPDIAALQQGVVKITICTADGFKSVLDHQSGNPSGKLAKHAGADFCPFSFAHNLVLAGACCHLAKPVIVADASVVRAAGQPEQKRLFNAAQPRAPPTVV